MGETIKVQVVTGGTGSISEFYCERHCAWPCWRIGGNGRFDCKITVRLT